MKKLLALAAMSLPLMASAQLANGDLEAAPSLTNGHWLKYVSGSDTPWGDDLNAATGTPGALGDRFVYFDVDNGTGTLTMAVTITADNTYDFGGYILQTGSGQNNALESNWSLTLGTGSVNGTAGGLTPANNWNAMAGQTFLTAGSYNLTFTFNGGAGIAKDVAVDNFYVTAVPEPESFALMAAGLAALGFLARRRRA